MLQQFRPALTMLILLTVLTGIVYPGVITGIAQLVFPHQANGSFISAGETSVGSEFIGQQFSAPEYFWGRLSATGPQPYNAGASSGTNFGPSHPQLKESAENRIAELRKYTTPDAAIPVDLVTASASGLDPQISLAAAEFQVLRVAEARKMTPEAVREMVRRHATGRQLGVLGEPCVNVLQLNLELDRLSNRE